MISNVLKSFFRKYSLPISLSLGLFVAEAYAQDNRYQAQPIFNRYAKTASEIYAQFTAKYFEGVELQEGDDFDGWTLMADATFPFLGNMQIHALVPFYTEGEIRLDITGEKTDVDGNGGVFEFATLSFEHQLIDESDHGFNLAYYIGFGGRTDRLETDFGDVINHRGKVVPGGVRYDQRFPGSRMRLLGNLGARYYYDTDDLNPASEADDTFWIYELNGAAVFGPFGGFAFPAAELLINGIDGDYLSVSLLPELILSASAHLELKLAGVIGLTDDGEDYGARFQLTGRF
jgi:hypothetical protein